ncbi:MAG: hypothetical protein ACHREM_17220 [Polyangiales bacterium]
MDPARALLARQPLKGRAIALFFGLALVVAAALRTVWIIDMEYKGDERFMFDRSQAIPAHEPWPELGMPSGQGLRNPAFSIWIFVWLARYFHANTPLLLDRSVIYCNVAAFVGLAVFAWTKRDAKQREAWLWAMAIGGASGISVLLHRKIWAQSVLPIFCVAFLIGWSRRDTWIGAALWGLFGALLGQIHMSGFFFAFAFFLVDLTIGSLRFDRPKGHRTKWPTWIIGSCAGAYLLKPWIKYVLSGVDKGAPWSREEVMSGRFFRTWFSDTCGLGLDYSLGGNFPEFLKGPKIGHQDDVYLPMLLQGVGFTIGIFACVLLVRGVSKGVGARVASGRSLVDRLLSIDDVEQAIVSSLLAYGVCITLSGIHVYRHYLLVTFPLEWLSLAWVILKWSPRPRVVLGGMWLAQLGLSYCFLTYIHEHKGAPWGDYGQAYRVQNPAVEKVRGWSAMP